MIIFLALVLIILMILIRSEEHTSELQSHYSISYAVFCLKKKEIPVYSEKYGVHGKVLDYGVVTKLVFNYSRHLLVRFIFHRPT